MNKKLYKNIELLISDKDVAILDKMLNEPVHRDFNIDLGKVLETDGAGRIVFFVPPPGMKWALIFYFQNLMIRQRLDLIDAFLDREGKK